MNAFNETIYAAARQIPEGYVATYGQLAALAGKPRAARAAGAAMRQCGAADVPCHRVVFHDGALCRGDAFGGLPALQRQLLVSEGVCFCPNGNVNLRRCLWRP